MPRAWIRAYGNNHNKFVVCGVAAALVISATVTASYLKKLPVPTMTKEYEEMTDEYMKFMNMNPIFGKLNFLSMITMDVNVR
jgi:hypothetical protein